MSLRTSPAGAGFDGRTIVSFESRRATEIGELIRRHGGIPLVAPSMREIPLEDHPEAQAFFTKLAAGDIDLTIFLTGVGLRALVATRPGSDGVASWVAALKKTTIVARGPKPVAALREIGLQPHVTAPEPNTWRELLTALDAHGSLADAVVAVQEYGIPNEALLAALAERGARVIRVPIYRWALPDDVGPLRAAIDALIERRAAAALFTSATQVFHVFEVAGERSDSLRAALAETTVASIGPVCSEALAAHGAPIHFEPEHPKMGQLVGGLARRLAAPEGNTE